MFISCFSTLSEHRRRDLESLPKLAGFRGKWAKLSFREGVFMYNAIFEDGLYEFLRFFCVKPSENKDWNFVVNKMSKLPKLHINISK